MILAIRATRVRRLRHVVCFLRRCSPSTHARIDPSFIGRDHLNRDSRSRVSSSPLNTKHETEKFISRNTNTIDRLLTLRGKEKQENFLLERIEKNCWEFLGSEIKVYILYRAVSSQFTDISRQCYYVSWKRDGRNVNSRIVI